VCFWNRQLSYKSIHSGGRGFGRELATSSTVAKLELEPRFWCPGPISFHQAICLLKESDFISIIKPAAESRHILKTKIRVVC
jgi:hypothetical protein